MTGQSSNASPSEPSAPSASIDGGSNGLNGSSGPPVSGADQGLVAAAQAEGTLTVIGLPRDRCNYAGIIDTFSHTYELTVTELDPGASAADQLQAIAATVGGAAAPDVVDLSMAAAQGADAGLLEPFKVSTWSSIPDALKAPDGAWAGNYYGVVSFEINTGVVPTVPGAWADLLGPRYKAQIALAGDPRTSGDGAFAVYSAALANGGTLDDARKGLDFFKALETAGNLLPRAATPATIDDGQTPVTMRRTYESLPHRDAPAGGAQIEVAVPAAGRLALANAQAISAHAEHPNAARLWLEFLYSDQGQNLLLDGYCHPIRFDDLAARDAIPVETLAKLPETSPVVFPSVAQQANATDLIAANWDRMVGVDIR
ncbi:MAG TPA: ABC transporter substrate-binding protein [Candidatus Dormibacteraeota bacterium]|nr:ABC transporter substrate-binding protein [Candidatus Dormibacteraeota bacterium]